MEERAGGDRGLQPTTGAHPQPCARAPAVTAAAVWTREPVRPAQFGQILPTGPLVGEPRPKLLVSPRIVTPTDRSQIASHDRPPYCTQADMQDTDPVLIKEDHAVNSKLGPLDASRPSAGRRNLGPQQGERLQLARGEGLQLAGVSP